MILNVSSSDVFSTSSFIFLHFYFPSDRLMVLLRMPVVILGQLLIYTTGPSVLFALTGKGTSTRVNI